MATVGLSTLTVALVARIWLAAPVGEAGTYRGAAATVLGSILVNPHVNIHDLSLLFVAMAFVAGYLRHARGLSSADALLPVLLVLFVAGPNIILVFGGNLYTPLLGLTLLWLWRQDRTQIPAERLPGLALSKAA